MKPQELRIGNLVKLGEDVVEVIEIQLFIAPQVGIMMENGDTYRVPIDEIEPVLLTKEILRGFGCNTGYWYLSVSNLKAELHFEIYPSEVVTALKSQFSDLILDPLVYAHQLQNLYYALTAKELTLKKTKQL